MAKLCVVMRFAAVGTPGRSIATPRTPMSPRGSTKTGASVAATSKTRGSKKQRAPVEPVESPKGNPLAGILGAVAGGVQRGLSLLLGVGGGRKKRSRWRARITWLSAFACADATQPTTWRSRDMQH